MDQSWTISNRDIARKEINMIINENNKNTVLKGMVKRGFNQDPAEIRAKLHPDTGKVNLQNQEIKMGKQVNKGFDNVSLKETFNKLKKL